MSEPYLKPIGIEDVEEFIKLWYELYDLAAKTQGFPQIVFDTGPEIIEPLRGRVVVVRNGYWRPVDGTPPSYLLSFIEDKGAEQVTLFNLLTLKSGTGEVHVMTHERTPVTQEQQDMITGLVMSIKEYLRMMAQPTQTLH